MNNQIRPIYSEEGYEAMVSLVDQLIDAEPGSEDYDTLQVASELVWAWEQKNVEILPPTPIEAIKFRLEQRGMSPRDLRPYIGSDARVGEVMTGKRSLTLPMVRALHEHLGIPLESLVVQAQPSDEESEAGEGVSKQIIAEIAKLGWLRDGTESSWTELALKGDLATLRGALCRQNSHSYANAKSDPQRMIAWCLYVRAKAASEPLRKKFTADLVTPAFLRDLAQASALENGPALAKQKLNDIGVHLVFARHLRGTYLDGAAMVSPDGNPAIGMTLRHNRLDNFWHCLFHELGHVKLHLSRSEDCKVFHDDFELKGVDDPLEQEADEFVRQNLFTDSALTDLAFMSTARIKSLARSFGVHEAIVAGRVRHRSGDYAKFAKLLGHGEPRRVLGVDW